MSQIEMEREVAFVRFVRADNRRRTPRILRRSSPRKRVFDAVMAGIALSMLAPALLSIWVAVRLTSKGPGLHWSERVGRGGRKFLMPKFRTMYQGTPATARELLANADRHITPLGAVLRRCSLDEFPQLISILKGDMSFVGPRPLLPSDPAQIARRAFPDIFAARPGLSGLAQVRGRNLVSPRRKARLDAFYVRRRSAFLDLEICGRTVVVLLTGHGILRSRGMKRDRAAPVVGAERLGASPARAFRPVSDSMA